MSGSRYAVINGIDFGGSEDSDALVMNSSANLILTGAVENLERISANISNRIFVTNTDIKASLANVKGYKANIVEEINLNEVVFGDDKDSLFTLDADSTLEISGASEGSIEYFDLAAKTWVVADSLSFSGTEVSLVKVKDTEDFNFTLA